MDINPEESNQQKINTTKPVNVESTFDQLEWANWLSNAGYSSDLNKCIKAGTLMYYFQSGANWLFDEFKKRSYKWNENVGITIMDTVRSEIFYDRDTNNLVVSYKFLNDFTQLDYSNLIHRTSSHTGEQYTSGYPHEIMFVTGIEEAHHSQYQFRTPQPKNQVGLTVYDSLHWEYQALGWKIKAAKEKNFSDLIVNNLEKRLQNSIEHKRNHPRKDGKLKRVIFKK